MENPIIKSVFQFKNYLDDKGMLVHWQYLVLAAFFSFFGGLVWAYISIIYQMEFGFIAALIGLAQGFLAFMYMKERGDPRLVFYSFVFSILSFFLGKYLMYVHNYDWILSGVVDKSDASFSLVIFYLRAISYESIGDFVNFYKLNFGFFDILWLVIIIVSSLEYQLFYRNYNDSQDNNKPKPGSYRRIRRRF